MLRKLNSTAKSGFTLVEIMIVVAIIALLAAIAVPNFLRARKRSQATALLEEMRIIDAAKDQYAIENNMKGDVEMDWAKVKNHVKPGTRLANIATTEALKDIMGGAIDLGKVDEAPTLDDNTVKNFYDVVKSDDFWGAYATAAAKTADTIE